MRRSQVGQRVRRGVVATVIALSLAGPRVGHALWVTAAEGVIHISCASDDQVAEPVGPDLSHTLSAPGFSGSGLLLTFDTSDGAAERADRVRVTSGVEAPNGRTLRIGAATLKPDPRTGEAEAVAVLKRPVAAGDRILWDVRLRRFDPIEPGACISLLLAVTGSDVEGTS